MLRLAFDFIITWRETRTRPNAYRVNIESNRKVADAYEIEIAPSLVLQRKGKMLWEKTGEVFPGELRDVIEMFKN